MHINFASSIFPQRFILLVQFWGSQTLKTKSLIE
jgi:hypothetical protein